MPRCYENWKERRRQKKAGTYRRWQAKASQGHNSPQEVFPQDLWHYAYEKLTEKDQNTLHNIEKVVPDDLKQDRSSPIDKVIQVNKGKLAEYEENLYRPSNGPMDSAWSHAGKNARKIFDNVLTFQDVIGKVAGLEQHAASAWTLVSLGLMVSQLHQLQ